MADEDLVLVTLDGAAQDAARPMVYVDDLALLRGDGVFETLLVRGGEPCTAELHLGRLRRSAEAVELPEPDLDDWRAAMDVAAKKWGAEREGMMRLVLTRGRERFAERDNVKPTAFVTVGPVPARVADARAKGVSAITLQRGQSIDLSKDAPWLLLGAKTLSYAANMSAVRFAHRNGADDAIFLSTEGRVLEGTRSTVVIARGRKLITPPHKHGIVPGTTQRALFEVAEKAGFECSYAPLFGADLILAEGIWMLSSVTLAARVHCLDGLNLLEPDIHPELMELVDRAVGRVGTLKRR